MIPLRLAARIRRPGAVVAWIAVSIFVDQGLLPDATSAQNPPAQGSPAQATPIYQFGEIVVTADQPRVVEEVTTLDVVTAEEIERSGARTLDEALALLPGLQLRRGAEGVALLDVRGLRARNVLLLLDGVPVNSSFDGLFDPATLSLASVARIEVTRGASSVLYGPTGNAGVVDIVTRAAPETGDASLLVEGGTPGTSRVAGRGSWRRGDLGLVASGTFARSDGFDLADDFVPTALEDGGRRLASDREDRSLLLSLASTPERGPSWGLNLSYRGDERGKPPATEDFRVSDFAPRTRFERVESDTLSLHAGLSAEIGSGLVLRPTLFANRTESLTDGFDDDSFASQEGAGAFREDAVSEIAGAGVQLALDRPSGLWTLGIDARRERWRAEGFEITRRAETPIDESYQADVTSLAIEYELAPGGPWSAVAGVGFAAQNRPGTEEETGFHWLVGATRSVGAETTLRGSIARQIRSPTLRDLFDAERGNPDLVTERTLHYELGLETAVGARSRFELVLFRSDAEDFIQGVPGDRLANTERVRRQGAELVLRRGLGDLRFVATYTFLDAENRSSDADVSAIQNQPEHSGSLAVDWAVSPALDLRAEVLVVADRFALSRTRPTRTLALADYAVLDLRGARSLGERLRLVGRVDNVLDESYEESIAFPGPGRTFFLGLELRP